MPDTAPMSIDRGRDLAADLIRELAQQSGDAAEVDTRMARWVDELGVTDAALVSLAAVRSIFVDCLTPTPAVNLPPGRLGLLPTLKGEASA